MIDDTGRSVIPLMLEQVTGEVTPVEYLRMFNGHRHTLTYLTSGALTAINHWDTRYETALVVLLGVGETLLLTLLTLRAGVRSWGWLLPVIATFTLSPQLGVIWLSTLYTSWHYNLFFVLLALAILNTNRPGYIPLAMALTCCLLSLLSLGSGLVAWGAVFIYLLLTAAYRKWHYVLLTILVAVVCNLLYIGNSIQISTWENSTGASQVVLDRPDQIVQYFLQVLGAILGFENPLASAILGGLGLLVLAIHVAMLSRNNQWTAWAGWAGMVGFSLASIAMIAVTRWHFDIKFALHERYMILSTPVWLAIITLSVYALERHWQAQRFGLILYRTLAIFTLVGITGLAGVNMYLGTWGVELARGLSLNDIKYLQGCLPAYPLRLEPCHTNDSFVTHDLLAAFNIGGYQRGLHTNILGDAYQSGEPVVIVTNDLWYSIHLRDRLLVDIPSANIYHVAQTIPAETAAWLQKLPHPPQLLTSTEAVNAIINSASTLWVLERNIANTSLTHEPSIVVGTDGFAQGVWMEPQYGIQIHHYAALPPEFNTNFLFGTDYRLLHWELTSGYSAHVCHPVTLVSFWEAESYTDVRHLTLTLADANGNGVARVDTIASTPTQFWQVGNLYYDRRTLLVPCDLAPGSYSVLLGVYSPETLQVEVATTQSGEIAGDLLYLTTIVVNP
ncbi:MAG: hypothetical protein ACOYL5_01610 [Phototrophicaceae bacterium]